MQNLCDSATSADRRRGHDWDTNLVHPVTKKKVAYTCDKYRRAVIFGNSDPRNYAEVKGCQILWKEGGAREGHFYPSRCKPCAAARYARQVSNKIAKLVDDKNQHCLLTFTLPEKVMTEREGLDIIKKALKKLTRTANWIAMFDGWVYCYETTSLGDKQEVPVLYLTGDPEKDHYGERDFAFTEPPELPPQYHAHIHMIAKRTGTVARITPEQLARLKDDAVRNGLGKVVHVAPVKRTGAYKKKTARYLAKYISKRQGRPKNGTRLWERGGVFRNKKG
jgi:hypothetical protein